MAKVTVRGLDVIVDDKFLELSPEEQGVEVDAIVGSPQFQSRLQEPDTSLQQDMNFLNQGLAKTLGFFTDPLVAAGGSTLNALGVENQVRDTEGLFGAAGIQMPEEGERPQTLSQRIGRGVGEAAGAIVPLGATAQLAAKGTGLIAQIANQINQTLIQAPATAFAVDVASGAGAGAGGHGGAELASALGVNPDTGEAIGSILGGIGAPFALSPAARAAKATARGARKISPIHILKRNIYDPFTEAGSRARASARARSLASDPEAAARRATADTDDGLSAAQRTGEPRLLALEKEVLKRDPSLEDDFQRQIDDISDRLEAELQAQAGTGSVDDSTAFLNARRERLINATDERARQALVTADERIAKLSPERQPLESSKIVREELEVAFKSARDEEKIEWGRVKDDIIGSTSAVKTKFAEIIETTPRAQLDDIPDSAHTFLGGKSDMAFADEEPVKELAGLYSRFRADGRKAAAAGDGNEARLANDLAEAVLADIRAVKSTNVEFNSARQYSFDLNEKFTRGPVGRLLARSSRGGPSIDPQLTLQSSVGRGGDTGAVEAQGIQQAAPGTGPEIEQFLRSRFPTQDGRINVTQARRFVDNETALEQFPGLREQMLGAIDAEDAATRAGNQSARLRAALDSKKSKISEFLGAPVGDEIARVLRAKNPGSAARELKRQARGSAEALDGLKTGTIDHLLDAARKGPLNDAGEQSLSGKALKAALKNDKMAAVASEILTPAEIKRLDRLADKLVKVEAAQRDTPDIGGQLIGDWGSTLNTLAGVIGARLGSKISKTLGGGGSIQTPHLVSRLFREKLGKFSTSKAETMITEAVKDKSGELLAGLLAPARTPAQQKAAVRRLNAWFAGPAGRAFTSAIGAEEDEAR